jgi:hypothetical protein
LNWRSPFILKAQNLFNLSGNILKFPTVNVHEQVETITASGIACAAAKPVAAITPHIPKAIFAATSRARFMFAG